MAGDRLGRHARAAPKVSLFSSVIGLRANRKPASAFEASLDDSCGLLKLLKLPKIAGTESCRVTKSSGCIRVWSIRYM